MKKSLLFLMMLAVIVTGCKKDKSKSLEYNDSDPIKLVLHEEHQIQVTSEYDITYTTINSDPNAKVISMPVEGCLFGMLPGTAKVIIDNGYENRTVNVKVDLFRQPTFDFGCNTSKIRSIYGTPTKSQYVDTVLVYRYMNKTSLGYYSYSCYELRFCFIEGRYDFSQAFIVNTMENPLLNDYLTDNFNYFKTVPNFYYDDTITHDSVPADVYKYKLDTTIFCCKYYHSNGFDDIGLYYFKNEPDSLAKSLKIDPRSSKLRY